MPRIVAKITYKWYIQNIFFRPTQIFKSQLGLRALGLWILAFLNFVFLKIGRLITFWVLLKKDVNTHFVQHILLDKELTL